MALEIEPLAAALGAEVHGWDPSQDLSAELVAEINRGLREHLALVFRGHAQPTDAELVRFARHFGDLIVGTGWFGDDVEFPEESSLTLHAETRGGRIQLESDIRLRGGGDHSGPLELYRLGHELTVSVDEKRVRGDINGGGRELRLSATGGNIRVSAR